MGRASKMPVDVSLGDNMNISRQHAKIVYSFDSRSFELIVMGKNGEHVDCMPCVMGAKSVQKHVVDFRFNHCI